MSNKVSLKQSNACLANRQTLQTLISNLKHAYLFAEIDCALAYCHEIREGLATHAEQFDKSDYYFYDSLAALAKLHIAPTNTHERKLTLSRVANNQIKLHDSNKHHSATRCRSALIDAETQRIAGNKEEAIDQYDLAIATAKKDHHTGYGALANELAAKFYEAWGKDTFASIHMIEAHNCYRLDGADEKAANLCETFPQLLHSQRQRILTTEDYSLTESEARYQQLVEDGTDLVWSADADCRFTYLSSQLQYIFGLNPDDWIGRTPDELIHPDDLKAYKQATDEPHYDGHTFYCEFRHLCNDGSYKRVMIKGTTFCDSEGTILRQQGIIRDISVSKAAELETQIQFQRMAENAPGMLYRSVLTVDGDVSFTYIGPQVRDIFQLEPEEVLHNPRAIPDRVHPDDLAELVQSRAIAAKTLKPYTCVCRLVLPDGNQRWVKIMSHPYNQSNGSIVFDGCVVDITDIKCLEAEKERQLQIIESTSDFIGTCDPEGDITYLNEANQKLSVNSYGEQLQRTHVSHNHPQWATEILLEQGKPWAAKHGMWSGETAILDGDDNEIPVSQVLIAHKTLDGEVEYFSSICRDIRPQKATERALEQAGYRTQHVTDSVPGMIYEHLFDKDGSFIKTIFVNSNVKQMYGLDAEQVIKDGTSMGRWVNTDDLARLKQQIALSIKSLKPFTTELRVTLPGQATRLHQTTGRPELLKDRYVSLAGVTLDITDQKAAENALQQAQTRLHAVAENAPGMIYRYVLKADGSHYVEYVSSKVEELYGVTVNAVMRDASVFFAHIHPDDAEKAKRASRESAETLNPVREEFRLVLPNQGLRWRQVFSQPSRNENGDIIWDGIVFDTTEQKITEKALQDAHVRFHRIAENLPGMIYRLAQHTNGIREITYVSSKCSDLFEVDQKDALGDAENLFKYVHIDDVSMVRAAIDHSCKQLSRLVIEYRVQLPQKGLCWRQSIAQPTRTAEGYTEWDSVAIDITQRKNSELRLQSANEQMAKATKMKDEFLANMSHELRTPLTAMLSMSEGMERGLFGPVTFEQEEGFDVIRTSGAHLLEMINEVLDLAKIESGSAELNQSFVEIDELCKTCIQLATQQANKKNIQLVLQIEDKLTSFQTDEKRVRQILANLVSNAIKFTPTGGKVTLIAEHITCNTGDFLRLSVTDTGIGIKESDLKTLFEPFVQVETSLNRNYNGTGLGLALVKNFAELLSGNVGVVSDTGIGSTFYVDLPFKQPEHPAQKTVPQKRKASIHSAPVIQTTPETSEGPSTFILLAEDDEAVAKVTTRYLELLNYRVLRSKNGEETIDMAQEHRPDIILMDIQMPGIDGLKVIDHLRKTPKTKNTPIIALTGLAMEGDSKRCLNAGADRYLSKPYRMQKLIDIMDELLAVEVA